MLEECGYCLSNMQCLAGTNSSGPLDGTPCDQWTFSSDVCPGKFKHILFLILSKYKLIYLIIVIPNCRDYTSCGGCADIEECVWCESSLTCTSLPEALGSDCRGLVFDPPCPDTFVSENVIVGNLNVQGDPSLGGGELNVDGMSFVLY